MMQKSQKVNEVNVLRFRFHSRLLIDCNFNFNLYKLTKIL